jgi:hypothetical protein
MALEKFEEYIGTRGF